MLIVNKQLRKRLQCGEAGLRNNTGFRLLNPAAVRAPFKTRISTIPHRVNSDHQGLFTIIVANLQDCIMRTFGSSVYNERSATLLLQVTASRHNNRAYLGHTVFMNLCQEPINLLQIAQDLLLPVLRACLNPGYEFCFGYPPRAEQWSELGKAIRQAIDSTFTYKVDNARMILSTC